MKREAGGAEERRAQDDGEAAAKSTDEVEEATGKIKGFLGGPAEAVAAVAGPSPSECVGKTRWEWALAVIDGLQARLSLRLNAAAETAFYKRWRLADTRQDAPQPPPARPATPQRI